MFFLVQFDKNNLPRYLLLFLLALVPLFQGANPLLSVMVLEVFITIIFIIFWLASMSRKPKVPISCLDLYLFLFLLIPIISYCFVPYKHEALKCLLLIIGYIILYYLILFNFSRSNLQGPMVVLILSALLQAIIGLFQYSFFRQSPTGTFGNANFYAGFLIALLPLSMSEALFRKNNPLWYLSQAIIFVSIILSSSLWMLFLLIMVILFLLYFFQQKKILCFILLFLLIGIIFPHPVRQIVTTALKRDPHTFSCLSNWRTSLAMIKDNWKTGVGLGQYRYISRSYGYPAEDAWAKYSRIAAYAYNEYLHFGAEMGLFSLFLVFIGVIWFFIEALGRFRSSGFNNITNKNCQIFFLAGIFSILVHGMVDYNLHAPSIVIILITFCALFRIMNERTAEKQVTLLHKKIYRIPIIIILLGYSLASVRMYLGYHFNQKAGPGHSLSMNIKLLKEAVNIDALCAGYHDSLSAAYFNKYGESQNIIWLVKGMNQGVKAGKLNPNDYRFARGLGDRYYNVYKFIHQDPVYLAYAQQEFIKAVQLAPFDYRLYDRLASIEFLNNRMEKSLEYMLKAVSLEPNYLKGHYQLALIKEKLGNIEGSFEDYNKMQKIRDMHLEEKAFSKYEQELIEFDDSILQEEIITDLI